MHVDINSYMSYFENINLIYVIVPGISLVCLIFGIIIYKRKKTESQSNTTATKAEKEKHLPKPLPKNEPASKKEVKPQPTKPWKTITGVNKKESEKQMDEQPPSKKIDKPSTFVTPSSKSPTSPHKDVPKSQNLSTPPIQKDTPISKDTNNSTGCKNSSSSS